MNRTFLNETLDSYIETALWAETADYPDEDALSDKHDQSWEDAGYTRHDLEPSAMGYMARDIERFVAGLDVSPGTGLNAPRWLGHNLWLTRQGHGAGFQDYDEYPQLAEKANALGECYLHLTDDGKIGLAQ